MRCRLFNFATVLSLVLFPATVAMWVRSYFVNDRYQRVMVPAAGRPGHPTIYTAATFKGEIVGMCWVVDPPRLDEPAFMQSDYEHVRQDFEMRGRNPSQWTTSPPHALDAGLRWGGFGYLYSTVESSIGRSVFVPLWAPTLLFLLPPIFWLVASQRRMRTGCPTCNYNLTGNTSGTCPECGTLVVKGAA